MDAIIIPDSIRDVLDYNPGTGDLTWKVRPYKRSKHKAGDKAGHLHSSGYVRITYKGIQYSGHRLAWWFTHDEMPEIIDHINRNPADNRICNLRNVTTSINALNRGKTGVAWVRTSRGEYKAYASYRMRHLYRGNNITTAWFRRIMAERQDHPIGLPAPAVQR